MQHEVHVDDDVIAGARRALDRMLAVGRGESIAAAPR
jgi:quinolinate synthase